MKIRLVGATEYHADGQTLQNYESLFEIWRTRLESVGYLSAPHPVGLPCPLSETCPANQNFPKRQIQTLQCTQL